MESKKPEQEELDMVGESRLSPVVNALLIGFFIGIIAYSIVVNSIGIFTLIPLYFLYKLLTSKGKTD